MTLLASILALLLACEPAPDTGEDTGGGASDTDAHECGPAHPELGDWYPDCDGDGHAGADPVGACAEPDAALLEQIGFSCPGGGAPKSWIAFPSVFDCDDADATAQKETLFYADCDGDGRLGPDPGSACGLPTAEEAAAACGGEAPLGAVSATPPVNPDCDDADAAAQDEGAWWPDCDDDGVFGADAVSSCGEPDGSPCAANDAPTWTDAPSDEDCDDERPDAAVVTSWYPDCDGDGVAVSASIEACGMPDDAFIAALPDPVCADGSAPARLAAEAPDVDDCDDLDPASSAIEDWYADCDGDGVTVGGGVAACGAPEPSCAPGALGGWILVPSAVDDCDDDDASVGDAVTWHADCDGDGFTGDETVEACAPPDDYVCAGLSAPATFVDAPSSEPDCDDADPTVHPGAAEIPGDGVDQDCDGADLTSGFWYVDSLAAPGGDGSASRPFDNLDAALAEPDVRDVLLASGLYGLTSDATTDRSLLGGYEANDWSADPVTGTTTIWGARLSVADDVTLSGLTLENTGGTALGGSDVTVRLSDVHVVATGLGAQAGVSFANSVVEIVGGSVTADGAGAALDVSGSLDATDLVVAGQGIGLRADGVVLTRSTFSGGTAAELRDRARIVGSTFEGLGRGIDLRGGGDVRISDSVIDADSMGVHVEVAPGGAVRLERSYVSGTGNGPISEGLHIRSGVVTLVNNVIVGDNSAQSDRGIYIDGATGAELVLVNNTLVAVSSNLSVAPMALLVNGAVTLVAVNNILQAGLGSDAVVLRLDVGAQVTLRNNRLSDLSGACEIQFGPSRYPCLATAAANDCASWDHGCVDTGGNTAGDPGFVGPSDLHLAASSACVDAGVDPAPIVGFAVGDDIDGDPRPLDDGWDVGADEAASP